MASQTRRNSPDIGVQALATATGYLMSGFALGIGAMSIPVLLDTNTEASQLVTQWARLYHYGHIYMPAASVAVLGLYGWAANRQRSLKRGYWKIYAAAGLSTMCIVPFTWLFIDPTNNVLFSTRDSFLQGSGGPSLDAVQALVGKWNLLHVVRSLLPLAGAALGSVGILGELRE